MFGVTKACSGIRAAIASGPLVGVCMTERQTANATAATRILGILQAIECRRVQEIGSAESHGTKLLITWTNGWSRHDPFICLVLHMAILLGFRLKLAPLIRPKREVLAPRSDAANRLAVLPIADLNTLTFHIGIVIPPSDHTLLLLHQVSGQCKHQWGPECSKGQ